MQLIAFGLRTCEVRTLKRLLSRPTERRVQCDRAEGEGVLDILWVGNVFDTHVLENLIYSLIILILWNNRILLAGWLG